MGKIDGTGREGGEIEAAYNVNYLIDAVAYLDCERIFLGFNKPESQAVIRPLDGSGYIRVIMPIRRFDWA